MGDEEAEAFAAKCRAILDNESGAGNAVPSADLMAFMLKLHDDTKAIKRFLWTRWDFQT